MITATCLGVRIFRSFTVYILWIKVNLKMLKDWCNRIPRPTDIKLKQKLYFKDGSSVLNWHRCLAKTGISLCIHPVRSESLLSQWRKWDSLATNKGHREDWPDWTYVQASRLIRVFAWHTDHFVDFAMLLLKLNRSMQWSEFLQTYVYRPIPFFDLLD